MADKRSPRRGPYPTLRAVPPTLRSGGEPFEGFNLLLDNPGEAGVVLWQIVRDVTLWASMPESNRKELFSPKAPIRQWQVLLHTELNESVRPYLLIVSNLLFTDRIPDSSELAFACRKIADWAEDQLHPHTAIAFAQAAALAWPESAECAYKVGWLARRCGEYARAESWLRRCIAITRRLPDMQSQVLAWINLGNIYLARGDHLAAEAAFRRALRGATRSGLSGPKALALHDLFALAVETHRIAEAEVLARRAARAIGATHPRLPILAHDVAAFWFSLGLFERAEVVFSAVLSVTRHPLERLQVLSSVARAAGGAGNRETFLGAWAEAWQIIKGQEEMECVATSALKLAFGSASLADWDRAELAARYATNRASEHRQPEVEEQAQTLLAAVKERCFRDAYARPPEAAEIEQGADVLACGLVRKLGVYAGVVQNRPRIPCYSASSAARADREDTLQAGG